MFGAFVVVLPALTGSPVSSGSRAGCADGARGGLTECAGASAKHSVNPVIDVQALNEIVSGAAPATDA